MRSLQFDSLLIAELPTIRGWCYSHFDDCEDTIQDAVTQALIYWQRWDGKCKLSTWIISIAKHIEQNKAKAIKDSRLIEDIGYIDDFYAEQEAMEEDKRQQELMRKLNVAFNHLPLRERQIIYLYSEDKSYSEIAKQANVTTKSVKTRVYKIRNKLRKAI